MPPNILIIHTDQHRADCTGFAGNPDVRTPHLDALAGDGVRYENCFCPYPMCTPSRYSFLTGLYARQHTGLSNHCTISSGLETFPGLLRAAGYATAAVGKMHFTPTYLDVGFDTMVLAEQDGPGRYDDDYHRELMARGLVDGIDLVDQVAEFHARRPEGYAADYHSWPSDLQDADYSTTWIGDRALEVLEDWTDGGHLLMVGFIKPHHPFDAPAPWSTMYDPEALTLLPDWRESCLPQDIEGNPGYYPHATLTEGHLRRVMAQYYGSISQIDYQVGRMLEVLRARGRYDDTLIVFTSDHGEYLGYHHLILKSGPMYDPLVQVPLVIKYPGRQQAGAARANLVSNLDVAPTLLRQAGGAPGRWMRGMDLADPAAAREAVFAEAWGGRVMVRTATRKLLDFPQGERRLFDLARDPYEVEDLVAHPDYQAARATLEARLARWALYDAVPPAVVDRHAPVRKAVPQEDHAAAEAYFRARMAEWGTAG